MEPNAANIWSGAKVEQILPVKSNGTPSTAGTVVILIPGVTYSLQEKIFLVSYDKNELLQAVKLKLDVKTCLVGIYFGSHTSCGKMEGKLAKRLGESKQRIIIAGGIKARYRSWDNVTNTRVRALFRLSIIQNKLQYIDANSTVLQGKRYNG